MTRRLSFTPAARLEVLQARDWYETKELGLGGHFDAELDRQVGRILANPHHFQIMLADVRRAKMRRFPYGLFFREVQDEVFVIACFHSSRDPTVWKTRL